MNVAVIHYNAGNISSVLHALERLGHRATLTADPKFIRKADKVIFPGVGEAQSTMTHLRKTGLDEVIISLQQPVLGICLGMQLLCSFSEENNTTCLGIIPQAVKRFIPVSHEKVPHVGWNTIHLTADSWLSPATEQQYVYFVHSYYVEHGDFTAATTEYCGTFSACLKKDNFYATQFHPEKSGKVGEQILLDFLKQK